MDLQDSLFCISILLLSYFVSKQFLRKFQNLPPTPFPTLPILGHLHLLKDPSSFHRTLSQISDKYGPVVGLHLGARRALLVSSPSAVEDCLHHNDVVFANRPRLVGAKILGYNYTTMLWAPYGPLWRNHRRIASTEILSPHRVQLLSNIRSDEVRSLIRRINDGDHRTVEIKPALFEMTNNIMMRMIAGKRFYGEGSESEEAKRFKEMVRELLGSGGATSIGDLFPWLRYLGFKGPEKKFKGIFVKMDKVFQDLVDEHRRRLEEGQRCGDDSGKKNNNKTLIEVLLGLQKSDPSFFTEDIIKGLIQILLLTGTETSSSTMEWALSLLLNYPHVLTKAQREIDEHVAHNRLIEENDLSHLPYLHCIINETLRMYPAAAVLPPHESSADCIVGGYHIPKGTMLFVNVWAMQNDSKAWDEPRVFKPERFEGIKDEHKLGYKYIPFGSGRRACPGENLALRLIGLTLGSLIQCFDWERVGEEMVDMEEMAGVNMWKAKPLKAKCRPRKDIIKLIS